MYEIVRSKTFTPIHMLYKWNEKCTQNYFEQL